MFLIINKQTLRLHDVVFKSSFEADRYLGTDTDIEKVYISQELLAKLSGAPSVAGKPVELKKLANLTNPANARPR